jgi:hypothetical protein
MASADALKALIEALEVEQKRRQAVRFGGHEDPREWFIGTLQQMAQRFAATTHMFPLDAADMSIIEKLACHFLPEHLRPAGLPTEDQIWAKFLAR